jgi:hypothetical protein
VAFLSSLFSPFTLHALLRYSHLSATTGSTVISCRAGRQPAGSAIAVRRSETAASVTGSAGLAPNSMVRSRRATPGNPRRAFYMWQRQLGLPSHAGQKLEFGNRRSATRQWDGPSVENPKSRDGFLDLSRLYTLVWLSEVFARCATPRDERVAG